MDSADESPGEFQLAYGAIILHESCISGLVGGCYICLGCMSVWRSVTLTYYICGFVLDGCVQCRRVSRCFPACIWNHNIARIMYLRSGWSIVASLDGVCLLVAQNTMGGVHFCIPDACVQCRRVSRWVLACICDHNIA